MMKQMAKEHKKVKPALPSYNAVPPPPSLYPPSPMPASTAKPARSTAPPSPLARAPPNTASRGRIERPKLGVRRFNPNAHESETEDRNMYARNMQGTNRDAATKLLPEDLNGSGGVSNSDETASAENRSGKASLKDLSAQMSNLSLLRSPSPSAMPSSRFKGKPQEDIMIGSVSIGSFNELESQYEPSSVKLEASSATPSPLHLNRSNLSANSAKEDIIAQKFSRTASPAKLEYVPVVASKSKPGLLYTDYWSVEEVSKALEAGEVFKSVLRVNAFNRNEAYATLKGLPIDILIDGSEKQNRAMEGDTVVMRLDPASLWVKVKGTNAKGNSPATYVPKDQPRCGIEPHPSNGSESCFQDVIDAADVDYCIDAETTLNQAQSSTSAISLQDRACEMSSRQNDVSQAYDDGSHFLSSTENGANEPPTFLDSTSDCNLVETGDLQRERSEGEGLYDGFLARSDSLPQHESEAIGAALAQVTAVLNSMPNKRPTGRIVHILEKSRRRRAIVGFLDVNTGNKHVARACSQSVNSPQKHRKRTLSKAQVEKLMLIPADSRFPKMVVFVNHFPEGLKKRLEEGDATVSSELVAAEVDEWRADCEFPTAVIKQSLGQGGEIEAQTAAILFEHAIHSAVFPDACLDCLPQVPWKIPDAELAGRKDLRGCCIFSIDPPTAKDLDDALSIEQLDDGVFRVGVHIADVSAFVPANSALDKEAQQRSTSVYLTRRVLPMLPGVLCEELCSLNPGVDRLAFSILWDLSASGQILHQWIGRTIIRSCCKLTYEHAQDMLDGRADGTDSEGTLENIKRKAFLPELHGDFTWEQIIDDIYALYGISQQLRELRFQGGALKLDNSKLSFVLDADGIPYDTFFYEYKQSNMIVEEFMLLANMTVAKVISSVFPDCALLRRHPGPNARKLKEFEEFCTKHGFELDTASAGALQLSLEKLQEALKDDPVLFSVLLLNATKPMQLAKYFCTGEMKDNEDEWVHYALATPYYTHFTSPIRRYPDIVVHRTLAAALEAEQIISQATGNGNGKEQGFVGGAQCFSGPTLDKGAADSSIGQSAREMAAVKHKIPGLSELVDVAAHCNERKLASRNVKEATDKLYLWAMLKKSQGIVSDARVLKVGPKFISLFICKIAMERRIYYSEMDDLKVEWLEATGTLILDVVQRKSFSKKHGQGKPRKGRDIALVVNPVHQISALAGDCLNEIGGAESKPQTNEPMNEENNCANGSNEEIEPAVLPVVLRPLSNVPVFLHAVGGENQPVDVGVRLYLSSYFAFAFLHPDC